MRRTKFPWASPDFALQKFQYERHEPIVSTAILQDNEQSPIKGLQADLPAMAAAKAPESFGVGIYPTNGIQAAVGALANLPGAIMNAPVEAANRRLQLAKDNLGLDYLQKLQANPGVSQYVTSIGPSGTDVGAMPYQNTLFNQSTGNYGPYLPAKQGQPNTQQPATTPPSAPVNMPAQSMPTRSIGQPYQAPALNLGSGGNPSSFLNGQGTTEAAPASSSTGLPSAPTFNLASGSDIPSSPVPIDSATAFASRMPSPADTLDWYQTRVDSRGAEARAETDGNGQFTGRTVIIHDPRANMQDQVVHPAYMMANLNGWTPADTTPSKSTPNPVLAAPPQVAAADSNGSGGVVPIPALSGLQQPTNPLASLSIPSAQNAYTQLQQGKLPPQTITAMGSPLTASSDRQAGTVSTDVTPHYTAAPWLNQPAASATPTGTQIPSAPRAQLVNANPSKTPTAYGDGQNAVGDDYWQKNYNMSKDDFGKLAANPNRSMLVGKSDTNVTGLPPDDKYAMTDEKGNQMLDADGKPIYYYKDGGNGVRYTVMNRTPYHETHVFPNGTTAEIDNQISQDNDKQMMQTSLEQGTAGGNWQNMSREQKEAAFRLASVLKNSQPNEAFTTKVTNLDQAIDDGRKLDQMITQYGTPADPTALSLRNDVHQGWSKTMNKLGPDINDITHGGWNPGAGDNKATALANQFQQFQNSIRQVQTARALPPGSPDCG